ncbi:MAG: CPBP family intramembrane metalloprotease [Phycisphaerales bacterium]|nr:CPBP family intramembrane metalloprotease [Phycisphaerales bacterium]
MQTSCPNDSELSSGTAIPVARAVAALLPGGPFPEARLVQRMPMPMPRWRALLELVVMVPVGILLMFLLFQMLALVTGKAESGSELAHNIIPGISFLVVGLSILRLAGHHCTTVGWTFRHWLVNIGLGMAALIPTYLLLFCAGMILVLLSPELMEKQAETQTLIKQVVPDMPFTVLALMMFWVTFWEEFVFRGFLLTRLHALFGGWWLAVPVGALIFGVLHLWQGPLTAVVIGLLGLVMGALFVWRKSLLPGWAFHFAHNVLIVQLVHSDFFNLPG